MAALKDVHIDLFDVDGLDRLWHRQRGQLQNRHRRRRLLQRHRSELGPDGNPLPAMGPGAPASEEDFFSPIEPNHPDPVKPAHPRILHPKQSHSARAPASLGDQGMGGGFSPAMIPTALPMALLPGLVMRPGDEPSVKLKPPRKLLPGGSRSERIAVDGDLLSYNSEKHIDGRVGTYVAGEPLSVDAPYFEVDILDTGSKGAIGIGLTPKTYPLDRQPGWNPDSVAFHTDDGKLFKCNGQGRPFGSKCKAGDRIGCGIKFDQAVFEDPEDLELVVPELALSSKKSPARSRRSPMRPTLAPVFFTQNGHEIGTVLMEIPFKGFYPAVGLHSEGEEVRLMMGVRWAGDDGKMAVDSELEEEWSRLHDMRINSNGDSAILEYTGKGKCISDVGLAIARNALDTSNHYFEVSIVDPGENCYIAVGLVKKNYPKKRHPGWNKGSIAYHADDGKLFTGCGSGAAFGPRCKKGDVMGCGILFPPDFSPDGDADDEAEDLDSSPGEEDLTDDDLETYMMPPPPEFFREKKQEADWDELFESLSESDSDSSKDGAIGGGLPAKRRGLRKRLESEEGGRRVAIFFTRNGQLVGKRDAFIPLGGFFPCIGMLSPDEKVRVDLHPLTG